MENNKLGQEPAFPIVQQKYDSISSNFIMGVSDIGISKRFYAACAAMQGLLVNNDNTDYTWKMICEMSYELSDELLRQENL